MLVAVSQIVTDGYWFPRLCVTTWVVLLEPVNTYFPALFVFRSDMSDTRSATSDSSTVALPAIEELLEPIRMSTASSLAST